MAKKKEDAAPSLAFSKSDFEFSSIDRRIFFKIVSGSTLAIASIGNSYAAVTAPPANDGEKLRFRQLSAFLTMRNDLDPALADRALSQLIASDSRFSDKVEVLLSAISASQQPDIDAYISKKSPLDPSHLETIKTILSTWYLGVTPAPKGGHPGFVTFASALMYEPTNDAINPPSYAHAGTGYWIDPPSSLGAPPKMPENIREWGKNSPKGHGSIPNVGADSTLSQQPAALNEPVTPYGTASETE